MLIILDASSSSTSISRRGYCKYCFELKLKYKEHEKICKYNNQNEINSSFMTEFNKQYRSYIRSDNADKSKEYIIALTKLYELWEEDHHIWIRDDDTKIIGNENHKYFYTQMESIKRTIKDIMQSVTKARNDMINNWISTSTTSNTSDSSIISSMSSMDKDSDRTQKDQRIQEIEEELRALKLSSEIDSNKLITIRDDLKVKYDEISIIYNNIKNKYEAILQEIENKESCYILSYNRLSTEKKELL